MSRATLDEILPRLRNVSRAGNGYIASCPNAGAHGHGDRKPSLSIREGDSGRVLLYCHTGCSYSDVAGALGINDHPSSTRRGWNARTPKPTRESESYNNAAAARLWQDSIFVAGTTAETYLSVARGISIEAVRRARDTLRFHPACPHPKGMKLAAMVAAVGRWDGEGDVDACAVHRTYLRADGSGKADVEPQKASLGPVNGGAIWLSESASTLVIGEGIETTLSAASAMPNARCAYAAAVSASNLAHLEVPPWARELIILADADPAGEKAANTLGNRATAKGIKARIARPPAGYNDFNDVLRAKSASEPTHKEGKSGRESTSL